MRGFQHQAESGKFYSGARGAMELSIRHLFAFVRGVREGYFAPAPPKGGCKGYCPARLFCWRYEPAHW